jgi:hypothetical protein
MLGMFNSAKRPLDQGQAAAKLTTDIDKAVAAAIACYVDRRLAAGILEDAAQALRVQDAINRPIR